jgi:hypothetical protein
LVVLAIPISDPLTNISWILSPKNVSVFIGISNPQKGYKCLDPDSGNVIFYESLFPFTTPTLPLVPAKFHPTVSSTLLPILVSSNDHSDPAVYIPPSSPVTTSHTDPPETSASHLSSSFAATIESSPLFSVPSLSTPFLVPAPSATALPSESLLTRSHLMTTRTEQYCEAQTIFRRHY